MLNLISSIASMKCPVCRKGRVFIHPVSYNIKEVGEMFNTCEVCGQSFRPEPGFYFGAAIVSYPLTVFFNLLLATLFYLIVGDIFNHVVELLITMVVSSLIILPLAFRYARIIWLHIVFKYKY